MPKRVIDGDSLWVSEKLEQVPVEYRVEYAWLIPLANSNGCFECSPTFVWREAYAARRPDKTIEGVSQILDAYESAKMLFRFQQDGKTFGFFIGAQKEGRLPKPSDRLKSAKQWQSGMLPEKQLAKFLGVTVKKLPAEYRDLLATSSRLTRDLLAETSPTGIGIGNGSGVGLGNGIGNGIGIGIGTGRGDGAASLPSLPSLAVGMSPTDNSSSLKDQDQRKDTNNAKNHPVDDDDPELGLLEPDEVEDEDRFDSADRVNPSDIMKYPFASYTEIGFARIWKTLMKDNKDATVPKLWEQMWVPDFKTLLESVTPQAMADIIAITQLPDKKQYWLRPRKLIEKLDLCKTMVREREKNKTMSVIRAEFKKKFTRLEQEHGV